jgi:hypothetical protein
LNVLPALQRSARSEQIFANFPTIFADDMNARSGNLMWLLAPANSDERKRHVMHRTMDRAGQLRGKSIRTIWTLTLLCVPIMSTDAIFSTAGAQKSSPDIIAKERRDPAAGDVVIINRRKDKNAAPNPYAPKSSQSEAAQRKPEQAKPKSKSKLRDDDGSRTARRSASPPSSQPELTPPLPGFNRSTPPRTARLQQFPQAGLAPRQREMDEAARRAPAPRRQQGRPAWRDDDDWRDGARERWRDDWQDQRRYRGRSRRQAFRGRSWRQCRRLAWRCEDGFEGACYVWERRCSR